MPAEATELPAEKKADQTAEKLSKMTTDATGLLPMGGEVALVTIPVLMVTGSAAHLIEEKVRSGSGDSVSVHVRRALPAATAARRHLPPPRPP